MNRRNRKTRQAVVGLLAALTLTVSTTVVAQETTGTIRGRVVDPQGLALPGVTITVTGPQGVKTAQTDTEGRFSVAFLTPGPYAVRGELQGFKVREQQGVNVSLGQTVDVPMSLELGGVSETVNITGSVPIVNQSTTTTGAVISSAAVAQLPVGRRVSDVTYLAPGVSSGGSVGAANPSISGGSGLENQYVIDGVNVTNQGYGALGSYSSIFGSLGNATPFDFVQEVQVKTGGYEAEFGQSTGGVVNVVTKSGSNDLRGSAFALRTARATRRGVAAVPRPSTGRSTPPHRGSATPASKAADRSCATTRSSSARSIRRGRADRSLRRRGPRFR